MLRGQYSYRAVAYAYCDGLEARLAAKKPIDRIASVASFFLSRIDSNVDPKLDKLAAGGQSAAKALRGQAAPDGESEVTVGDLESYVQRGVDRFVRARFGTSQRPERRGEARGAVALVRLGIQGAGLVQNSAILEMAHAMNRQGADEDKPLHTRPVDDVDQFARGDHVTFNAS